MKSKSSILILLISLISFLFLVGCQKQSQKHIVSSFNVTTQWQEIIPQTPLKAEKDMQDLVIMVDSYTRDDSDPEKRIKLPDGTVLDPEIEMEDSSGKIYRLKSSMLTEHGVGYIPKGETSFPTGKSFTKIRIRSDKPFTASEIYWHCMYLK